MLNFRLYGGKTRDTSGKCLYNFYICSQTGKSEDLQVLFCSMCILFQI